MCNFIEDYPSDKSRTLAAAKAEADKRTWCEHVDDDTIYRQLGSPEYLLYMNIIF